MHIQVPENSMYNDQGPVLGCMAIDSVSAVAGVDSQVFAQVLKVQHICYISHLHANTSFACWRKLYLVVK